MRQDYTFTRASLLRLLAIAVQYPPTEGNPEAGAEEILNALDMSLANQEGGPAAAHRVARNIDRRKARQARRL